MTYTLHYAPDNASLIIRLALEQRGLPYDTQLVDRTTRAQDSAAYRALNPHGLIPVLETPQGPIFETGAVLLWLADTHGGLSPAPQAPDRAAFLKWLFYLANTPHALLRQMFYAETYVEAAAVDALRAGMAAKLTTYFDTLNDLAATHPVWLGADTPSALDFYLCALLRWSAIYPATYDRSWFDLSHYPALQSLCEKIDALPATDVLRRTEGLGKEPFSNPHLPNPPEGSAT